MKRQVRRRIKRSWGKISCFSDCTGKVTISGLPYTAVDFKFKISEDLMFRCHLDMFKRWCLFPIVVVDGFFFQGVPIDVGVASDEWLAQCFDDDF